MAQYQLRFTSLAQDDAGNIDMRVSAKSAFDALNIARRASGSALCELWDGDERVASFCNTGSEAKPVWRLA